MSSFFGHRRHIFFGQTAQLARPPPSPLEKSGPYVQKTLPDLPWIPCTRPWSAVSWSWYYRWGTSYPPSTVSCSTFRPWSVSVSVRRRRRRSAGRIHAARCLRAGTVVSTDGRKNYDVLMQPWRPPARALCLSRSESDPDPYSPDCSDGVQRVSAAENEAIKPFDALPPLINVPSRGERS